jgi:1-deoxyxylulose-5-phosphate synthase
MLANGAVTAPIVGASRPDQLKETVKSLEVRLSAGALERLDAASQPFL